MIAQTHYEFISIGSFYLTETLGPGANRMSREIVSKKKGAGASVVGDRRIWLLEGTRVIHISSVQEQGTVLVHRTMRSPKLVRRSLTLRRTYSRVHN